MAEQKERFKILDAVISLTRERDVRSLQSSLVEILAAITGAEATILIKQDQAKRPGLFESVVALPKGCDKRLLYWQDLEWGEQLVQGDASITECMTLGQLLAEECVGGYRYLYPLKRRDQFSSVLIIYCAQLSKEDQMLINRLLRIYHNYRRLLDENERDQLTGLLNRKTFDNRISEIIAAHEEIANLAHESNHERRQLQSDHHHWLGVLDIDHFKRVNDIYGHLYGDEVLLLFAGLMEKVFRTSDLLFRYGGEEFVVVLSATSEKEAISVFERFRQAVESYEFAQVGRVTVSIGVCRITAHDYPSSVVSEADKALYYAKEHGRNQVCSFLRLVAKGELKALKTQENVELF